MHYINSQLTLTLTIHVQLEMCSKTQGDLPLLELFASSGKYDGIIRELMVGNVISMPNFMYMWSVISTLLQNYRK